MVRAQASNTGPVFDSSRLWNVSAKYGHGLIQSSKMVATDYSSQIKWLLWIRLRLLLFLLPFLLQRSQ